MINYDAMPQFNVNISFMPLELRGPTSRSHALGTSYSLVMVRLPIHRMHQVQRGVVHHTR